MSKTTEVSYNFKAGEEPIVLPENKLPRIGIYSGSFDPVHAGHIVFALKAQKVAGLESIYFVPERRPEHGSQPEHYVHRSIMLNRALKPYDNFHVFELPDARLNARRHICIIEIFQPAHIRLVVYIAQVGAFNK